MLLTEDDLKFICLSVDQLKTERKFYKVSEWAEENRYLPGDLSSQPGSWNNNVTPYLVEIMDCLSENSHIKDVVFMKGVQIGATTGVVENFIGYIISHMPGPTMMVTADKEMAQTNMELRVDRMIQSSDIAHLIFSQSSVGDKFSRKTGSTKDKKEFVGGYLLARGANSPGKLRSFSIRNLLLDEIDGYPNEVGNEGDPVSLAEARTSGYATTRKHLYISTPAVLQTSKINERFLAGDQRKFFVPCKDCGHYQELNFHPNKEGLGGVVFERDEDNNLIKSSVGYLCVECGVIWKNADKIHFLKKGEWRATSKSKDETYRSYHLNGLYSPIGMLSWVDVCQKWLDIKSDTKKLKAFINTVEGLPWEERGDKPKYREIMKNRLSYKSGTVPPQVLFLTAGCDVHKNHIDIEILGWARKQVSYSVQWIVLEGDTEFSDAPVWDELRKIIMNGVEGYDIQLTLVDSGYRTDQVYRFCAQFGTGVHALKGMNTFNIKKPFNLVDVEGYGTLQCVQVYVDHYKDRLSAWLKKTQIDESDPAWGQCFYPDDYDESYFKQYANEQKMEERDKKGFIRFVWKRRNTNAPNHAWDDRVYNLVAFDVMVNLIREQLDSFITVEEFYEIIAPTDPKNDSNNPENVE